MGLKDPLILHKEPMGMSSIILLIENRWILCNFFLKGYRDKQSILEEAVGMS